MKKLSMLFIMCMCAVIASGCNSVTEEPVETTTATEITTTMTEVVTTEDTAVTEEVTEVETSEESTTAEISEERAKIISAITETISAVEHAYMEEVTDPVILNEFFLIDVSDERFEEVVVYQCPMSATMSEIIVIKSSDIEYAEEVLNNRREKAKTQDAWYPADVENAEASIVGTTGDYAYFIINSTAADDESKLVSLLSE